MPRIAVALFASLALLAGCARNGHRRSAGQPDETLLTWIHATVRLQTESGRTGTGFLVRIPNEPAADAKQTRADDSGTTFSQAITPAVLETSRIILVTNKHIIDEDDARRRKAKRLTIFLNARDASGGLVGGSVQAPLLAGDSPLWREHPDPLVDILALDVSAIFKAHPEITHEFVDLDLFAPAERIAAERIDAGTEVLVVGFPLDLAHTTTHYPLVRQGMIATRTGERIHVHGKFPSGKVDEFVLEGFLLDGIILPGSSGSPVVLKVPGGAGSPAAGSRPPYLLGIVSRTTLAHVNLAEGEFPVLAGIGVVFGAASIRAALDLFDEAQD